MMMQVNFGKMQDLQLKNYNRFINGLYIKWYSASQKAKKKFSIDFYGPTLLIYSL